MIHHHPSETTLVAQAAGTLPEFHACVIDVHLSACARCRGMLRGMDEIGGALLAALPPATMQADALAHIVARLDAPVGRGPGWTLPRRPVSLADLAKARWQWIGPGLRLMPLRRRDASGTRLDLIRVAPGVALPEHGHTGAETACILQGGYVDSTGRYDMYDLAEGDTDLQHAPVAAPGIDCICITATTGRLQAHAWLARAAQWLIGV